MDEYYDVPSSREESFAYDNKEFLSQASVAHRHVLTIMFNSSVVVIGDSGVGKSELIYRLTPNHYTSRGTQTSGRYFGLAHLVLQDKTELNLQVWDSGAVINSKLVLILFQTQTFPFLKGTLHLLG